jgi:peptidoglycan/LPS O-acetylase OafA/YrhL
MFGRHQLLPHGYLAVEIFFIISGFLMMARFDAEQIKKTSFKSFFIKRFWRIYPVFFVVTIIGALIGLYRIYIYDSFDRQITTWFEALLLNTLVLPHMSAEELIKNGTLYPFAFQVWTIFWEFVIGLVFLAWAKMGSKSLVSIYLLIFAGFFMAIIFNPWINYHHPSLNIGWNNKTFFFGGGRAVLSLFAGIIAAKYLIRIPKQYDVYLKAAAIIILIIAAFYFNIRKNNLYFEYILTYIGFPIMIAGLTKFNNILFNNSAGDFFGKISYSMFMTHGFMLTITKTWFWMYHIKGDLYIGMVWLFCTISIAYMIYLYIEKPAGKIKIGL